MAVTESEITAYKTSIKEEVVAYADRLVQHHQQGNEPSFDKEIKFRLLVALVEAVDWYIPDPGVRNATMSIDEFEDIQRHINNIVNDYYWIDLS